MADSSRESRNWFLCVLLVSQVVLMGCTWPLWTTSSSFPAIPLFRFLVAVPVIVDRLLSMVLIGACTISALNVILRRISKDAVAVQWAALLLALALAVLNQHRLQPWHWLFVLIVAQVVTLNSEECNRVHRLTIASIYIFAGLSRLGFHTANGMSRQILALACTAIGLQENLQNETVVYWSCVGMTAMEVAIGCLLLYPRTRRTGIVLAILMHLFLFLTLGPLGLNHHAGVQFWNLFFVIAVPALFAQGHNSRDPRPTASKRPREWTFAASVILIPLSGLFGIADNWPSWQVYSPRPEVVRVFVRNSAVDTLPEPMKQFLGRPAPLQDWTPLRIDAWSLNSVNAPIYPQERFGIAVAWFVAEHIEENDIKVNIERPQLAFWKSHEWFDIEGRNELEKFAPMRRRRQ